MHSSNVSSDLTAAWATLASLRLPLNPQDVVDAFGSPLPLFHLSESMLRSKLPRLTHKQAQRLSTAPPLEKMSTRIAELVDQGIRLIPFPDTDYPPLLREISSPPAALWCRGQEEALQAPMVAIVGSRKATSYGLRAASDLALGLVKSGLVIASGGAYGVDAAAHSAALSAGGLSVAVYGTGIDQEYPKSHSGLFDKLAESGACVTEFGPGEPPRAGNFPIRNRLISGMSLGVVVIEAGEKSGALITCRFAIEQNREVFAVPGSIYSGMSVGTHNLIRSGAKLVSGVEDILEELQPKLPERQRPQLGTTKVDRGPLFSPAVKSLAKDSSLSEGARAILEKMGEEQHTVDGLIERSGLGPSQTLEALMELELEGHIHQLPGHQYVRSTI